MTDGQTDRQTPHDGKDRAMQSVTRVKIVNSQLVKTPSQIERFKGCLGGDLHGPSDLVIRVDHVARRRRYCDQCRDVCGRVGMCVSTITRKPLIGMS